MFGPSLEAIEKMFRRVLDIGDGSVKKIQELRAEITNLKEEKEELVFKKKLEEKEIAHLVKMKEEKILIETQKKEIELEKSFQKKEMELQTDYFNKHVLAIKEGQNKMEDIYSKILERLPNVNMEINRESR